MEREAVPFWHDVCLDIEIIITCNEDQKGREIGYPKMRGMIITREKLHLNCAAVLHNRFICNGVKGFKGFIIFV